jgi:hypothetical protein
MLSVIDRFVGYRVTVYKLRKHVNIELNKAIIICVEMERIGEEFLLLSVLLECKKSRD